MDEKPTWYTAEVDGESVTRPAHSAVDRVNLEARGWVVAEEQPTPGPPSSMADPHETAAERPAGSQQHATARVVSRRGDAAPEAGPATG